MWWSTPSTSLTYIRWVTEIYIVKKLLKKSMFDSPVNKNLKKSLGPTRILRSFFRIQVFVKLLNIGWYFWLTYFHLISRGAVFVWSQHDSLPSVAVQGFFCSSAQAQSIGHQVPRNTSFHLARGLLTGLLPFILAFRILFTRLSSTILSTCKPFQSGSPQFHGDRWLAQPLSYVIILYEVILSHS